MKEAKTEICFVGRAPCGCVVAGFLEDTKNPAWNNGMVKEFSRNGYAVERLPLEKGNALLKEYHTCGR